MCGICGIFGDNISSVDKSKIDKIQESLIHRGPDYTGQHSSDIHIFGFTRLSIIDLKHGNQPMIDNTGKRAIVFNGEIYNYLELREILQSEGEEFKTNSDTEVLFKLVVREKEKALNKLNGMFAFAFIDLNERELILARDHSGMKPLYYTVYKDKIIFSSELRALLKSGIPVEYDVYSVLDYLEYGYVHSPYTIIKNVYKLPPGYYIKFKIGDMYNPLNIERWYNIQPIDYSNLTENECVGILDELINDSVKRHLLSDVEVGVLLSGGLDSSLLASIVRKYYSGKIRSYSLKFVNAGYGLDESKDALRVANYLGLEHSEVVVDNNVFSDVEDMIYAL